MSQRHPRKNPILDQTIRRLFSRGTTSGNLRRTGISESRDSSRLARPEPTRAAEKRPMNGIEWKTRNYTGLHFRFHGFNPRDLPCEPASLLTLFIVTRRVMRTLSWHPIRIQSGFRKKIISCSNRISCSGNNAYKFILYYYYH